MEPTFKDTMSDLTSASGGIFSNLSDMTKFLRANLHPEKFLAQKEAILLSQKLGLGWDSKPGSLPIHKNGAMSGFGSYIQFDPTTGKGAIGMTNSRNTIAITELVEIALGKVDSFKTDASISSEDLKDRIGNYRATINIKGENRIFNIEIAATKSGFLSFQLSEINGGKLLATRLLSVDGKKYRQVDGYSIIPEFVTFNEKTLIYGPSSASDQVVFTKQ
jgi:CubicO group peptidase (beta-lactamase class C family)